MKYNFQPKYYWVLIFTNRHLINSYINNKYYIMITEITLPQEEIAGIIGGQQRIAIDIDESKVFLETLTKLTESAVKNKNKEVANILKGLMKSYREYYEKVEKMIKILYKNDKEKLRGWTEIVKTNQSIFRDLENELKKVS